jgi:dTMP kinase
MKNPFIALEGLSGSGKTTIAKIVAEKIGARFYQTPPQIFASFRQEIDQQADKLARFFFYLAGVMQASCEISAILKQHPVVCDRYFFTTICFHRVIGLSVEIPDFALSSLRQPDFSFLVVCEEKTRRKRLSNRGLSFNDAQEEALGIGHLFLAEYRKFKLIEIDNSADEPQIAASRVIELIL